MLVVSRIYPSEAHLFNNRGVFFISGLKEKIIQSTDLSWEHIRE